MRNESARNDGAMRKPGGTSSLEERLVELEVRVAFQDRLIADLDDVIRRLRDELDALRTDHAALVEQMDVHRGTVIDEKPPHW